MDGGHEMQELKRRMTEIERAIGSLVAQVRNIRTELTVIRAEATQHVAAAAAKFDRVVRRLDTMNTQIWSLRDDLPAILSEALLRREGGNI